MYLIEIRYGSIWYYRRRCIELSELNNW